MFNADKGQMPLISLIMRKALISITIVFVISNHHESFFVVIQILVLLVIK